MQTISLIAAITIPAIAGGTAFAADPPAQVTRVSVTETSEYGQYITDANGRALYLLEADSRGESSCYDACAETWPPALVEASAADAADPNVDDSLLATTQRKDGRTQLTYNGHPLYYYAKDRGPGQATGQDVTDKWGEWYLVTPQGEELEPRN